MHIIYVWELCAPALLKACIAADLELFQGFFKCLSNFIQ